MPAFRITLAYEGTRFVGWQRQAAGTSIQGLLEDALRALAGREVVVAGSGRTDAGVHALGQVASFLLDRPIAPDALVRALNARLPGEVRVLTAQAVPPDFHARFAARFKTYRYRIWNAGIMSPFERRYAWQVIDPLDVEAMSVAARLVEGHHDFAAFRAAGSATRATERTITASRIVSDRGSTTRAVTGGEHGTPCSATVPDGDPFDVLRPGVPAGALIFYDITGDGFLRHMVRTIVGTLVEIGRGRQPAGWMQEVMASGDRTRAGPTAPPEGLFLVRVDYDVSRGGGPPEACRTHLGQADGPSGAILTHALTGSVPGTRRRPPTS